MSSLFVDLGTKHKRTHAGFKSQLALVNTPICIETSHHQLIVTCPLWTDMISASVKGDTLPLFSLALWPASPARL